MRRGNSTNVDVTIEVSGAAGIVSIELQAAEQPMVTFTVTAEPNERVTYAFVLRGAPKGRVAIFVRAFDRAGQVSDTETIVLAR